MANAAPTYPMNILVVYGDIGAGTTLQRSGIALVEKLRGRGFDVIPARSARDGAAAYSTVAGEAGPGG